MSIGVAAGVRGWCSMRGWFRREVSARGYSVLRVAPAVRALACPEAGPRAGLVAPMHMYDYTTYVWREAVL